MLPAFERTGLLQPGIHWATWMEFKNQFGTTPHRRRLLEGLRSALKELKKAGCETAYIDGSFVTTKQTPGDYDACWEIKNVDPARLDPVLLTFDPQRLTQKAKYLGELFPASTTETGSGLTFLEFQQIDKETGAAKGIVALDLRGFDDD